MSKADAMTPGPRSGSTRLQNPQGRDNSLRQDTGETLPRQAQMIYQTKPEYVCDVRCLWDGGEKT